jgi:hypothetical protein
MQLFFFIINRVLLFFTFIIGVFYILIGLFEVVVAAVREFLFVIFVLIKAVAFLLPSSFLFLNLIFFWLTFISSISRILDHLLVQLEVFFETHLLLTFFSYQFIVFIIIF